MRWAEEGDKHKRLSPHHLVQLERKQSCLLTALRSLESGGAWKAGCGSPRTGTHRCLPRRGSQRVGEGAASPKTFHNPHQLLVEQTAGRKSVWCWMGEGKKAVAWLAFFLRDVLFPSLSSSRAGHASGDVGWAVHRTPPLISMPDAITLDFRGFFHPSTPSLCP